MCCCPPRSNSYVSNGNKLNESRMAIVYANMRLSEVVEEHPSLIPVINRFGIRLGLSDKSVRTLCEEHALDTDFLLTILNTYLNEEYFPEKKLQTFQISQLIDYLTKTNQDYLRYQLPNIERHLGYFIQQSPQGNQSLALLGRFFASFKAELTARIREDEERRFPYCQQLMKGHPMPKLPTDPQPQTDQPADDSIEALLADLKSIMVKHLTGEFDDNLCYAVLFAICSLEKDIKQHNRIRYRILLPMITSMEQSCVGTRK